jgi:hypothetical protein
MFDNNDNLELNTVNIYEVVLSQQGVVSRGGIGQWLGGRRDRCS